MPRYHLASLDISTGEFLLSETSAPDLEGELLRLRPAEVLLPEDELGDMAIKRASEAAARRCLRCRGPASPKRMANARLKKRSR